MENEVRQEYLDRWRDVVIAWLLAGVASKGDKAIAWGKPTTKVLAAVWQRMLHWDVPDGFSYCAELQAFRIKRNALRSVLRPDWRQVHARSDAESRKALAGLQREVGVFYRGKPFYELTTKFINTPRFEQLRDGTLTWEELDLPSSIIAEMRDTFFVDTSTTVPYAGAVFVG